MARRLQSGMLGGMLRLMLGQVGVLLAVSGSLWAQQPGSKPATSNAAAIESIVFPAQVPAEGARLLDDVRDGVFSFDDPAFYWICRFVDDRLHAIARNPTADTPDEIGQDASATARSSEPDTSVPWRHLIERPADYRGRAVTIEGLVLRSSAYDVTNRPGLNRLYQFELAESDTQAICTIVMTRDPGPWPNRTRVRIGGYFVKVRSFQTNGGETGVGPLLVGFSCEPLRMPRTGIPGYSSDSSSPYRWLYWAVTALAVIWFVMRGRLRRQRRQSSRAGGGSTQERAEASEEDLRWLLDREGRDLFE